MKEGDLVVVPHGPGFYVAEVSGEPRWDASQVSNDTAFRRSATWLNNKEPIARSIARLALQSRMKTQGTCSYATDLLEEIEECLHLAQQGEHPTFHSDLHDRLVRETLFEIRSGRINDHGFEQLLKSLLEGMGGQDVRIVPRMLDKGADLLATLSFAGAFRVLVAVQAKHYHPEPPVPQEVVQQLIRGIEAESADLGMVATSGAFSEEAIAAAEGFYEEKGIKIELVDGMQLATLLVEQGLRQP